MVQYWDAPHLSNARMAERPLTLIELLGEIIRRDNSTRSKASGRRSVSLIGVSCVIFQGGSLLITRK